MKKIKICSLVEKMLKKKVKLLLQWEIKLISNHIEDKIKK